VLILVETESIFLLLAADKTARIWDTSGKQLAILQHQEYVTSASFSPDGKRVITTSEQAYQQQVQMQSSLLTIQMTK
jgi:WD40 repeat protein